MICSKQDKLAGSCLQDVGKCMKYYMGLFLLKKSKCELGCGIDTDLQEVHSSNIDLGNIEFVMVLILRRNKPHLFGYFSILDFYFY